MHRKRSYNLLAGMVVLALLGIGSSLVGCSEEKGDCWEIVTSVNRGDPFEGNLVAIHGVSDSLAYAVGNNVVMQYDGEFWDEIDHGDTYMSFSDVWVYDKDIWVSPGGDAFVAGHYHKNDFESVGVVMRYTCNDE